MTQLNESPIITVERRKAVTIIVAAVIMSLAIGGGLMQVGSGFASRSSDGITVTGSAKTTATADNAVWVLNVSLSSPTVATAVNKVDADVAALSQYLTKGGIPADGLTLGAVATFANEEYSNGNATGRILSYRATREVTVRSNDVQLVSKLSQGIGTLLATGILVNVKAGPIQITTPDSTMTADYGAYDTSTIEKTVTATVSVTFKS